MIAINSVDVLKQHVDDSPYNEFFLRLNHFCRSSKTIQYFNDSDSWYILNHIDDSVSEYESTKELIENEPLIIKAMANNAFFKND
jgi:hypothetical protein